MPSSALGMLIRIRRSVPKIRNSVLRADDGIGPYGDAVFQFIRLLRKADGLNCSLSNRF